MARDHNTSAINHDIKRICLETQLVVHISTAQLRYLFNMRILNGGQVWVVPLMPPMHNLYFNTWHTISSHMYDNETCNESVVHRQLATHALY